MGLWNLFIVALMPVLNVLLITAVGVFLAIQRVDILGADARKHLNNLVFFVLSPALVGSNLAKYITLRSLPELWFMPLNVLITFVIGSVLGWLLVKITKAPKGLRGVIMGCCAAGNLDNMLLVIVLAVCKEKGSPFGVSDVCTGNGMAYVSLSMAIGSLYIWSYVYNIVRIYSSKDSDEAKPDVLPEGAESAGEKNESAKCRTGPPLPSEDPSLGESQHLELNCSVSEEKAKVPFPENIKRSFLEFIKKPSIRRLLAPAIIGAIVGLMIGIIPPFRKVLIGDRAPLHAVEDSADMVGKAAIPIITLILGANLLKGLKGSKVPLLVIIGIVAIRYNEPVVWSWPNRMLCDHATDQCLGHSLADRLVNILHLVC